jgi:hypothetical protein
LEPGRPFPCRGCLIRILRHLSYPSAKSDDYRHNFIRAPGPTQ